ncbi:AraC family transcriptional regulator [Dyadobacter sp. CY343]|uniref:helix-turn-helix domain-containing protein n=1 Tax=Dyadobacter sp. CY343 TaxID=2907299 RepID=UPI001F2C71E1|nr:helix-turn-helix domain-containing protein [Dyadobacter sp. CY343]MCE7062465.1 helix-turn-helix domain-containing protein [Dyadobacter sp. CY343]
MTPIVLPVRIDLFSVFMLLGWVQGLILAFFFLSHFSRNRLPNLFLGILILGMSLVVCDVWLGYTNLMFHVIWLNDATEPLNLIMAPMAYLYIRTSVTNRSDKFVWLHFLPFALYLVYMCIMVYPQSNAFKYHCYMDSFHPERADIPYTYYGNKWMFFPKGNIINFTLISMAVYNVATFFFLKSTFAGQGRSFFSKEKDKLSWYRDIYLLLLVLGIIFFAVRTTFPNDLGDHFIAAFIGIIIYVTGFSVLRRSLFFQETRTRSVKKYEKSSLTEEIQSNTLRKLEEVMQKEKLFLDPSFSMPVLAKRLGISTHHLSQILNEEVGQNFFDFLATYRIREAQRILSNGESNFIKIEEIAQMVGYNSKSAFNTAFRKITGATPSEFKKASAR